MATNILDQRRRGLGMTVPALATRSGVPESTLKRLLNRGMNHVAFGRVVAVAQALGLEVQFEATADEVSFQEREATHKAERILGLVQGSSGLEAQGVSPDIRQQMLRRTVHELMAGSKRRLWGT